MIGQIADRLRQHHAQNFRLLIFQSWRGFQWYKAWLRERRSGRASTSTAGPLVADKADPYLLRMTSFVRRLPLLLLFCVLCFNSLGLSFGMGAIFTDIMDTFAVSRATASLVQSVCVGFMYGFGIVTGPFVRTHGPRVTVITGSVLATVGCVIAFLATHIVQVIVGIGVLAGIGTSLNLLSSQIMAAILFHDVKSLALTAISISLASGGAVFPLMLRHVTNRYSVCGTFLILAAINCQMILCGALIGLFVPRDPGKTAVIRTEPEAAEEADVAVDAAGDEKLHGDLPGNSGDGDEDYHCSVESCNEESVRFVVQNQDVAAGDSRLNGRVAVLHEDSDDSDHDDPETPAPDECLERRLMGSKTGSDSPREEALPETLGHEPGPEDSLLSLKDTSECGRSATGDALNGHTQVEKPDKNHDRFFPRIKSGFFRCFSCSAFRRIFQLEIFRDPRFVVLCAFAESSYLSLAQPVMFMTDMVKSNNLSAADGSFLITVIYLGSLAGRLTAGILYRLLQKRVVFATTVSMATGGLSCLLFVFAAEYAHFVAVSLLYGVCFGLVASILPMTFLEILGPGRFAVGTGFTAMAGGVATFLAGPCGGLIRDLTNSYHPVYYAAFAHGLLNGTVLLFSFTTLRYRHHAS